MNMGHPDKILRQMFMDVEGSEQVAEFRMRIGPGEFVASSLLRF